MNEIVIIDDSHTDRYILKRELKSIGFKGGFLELENGEDAIDYFSDLSDPPYFVFLDISMPKIGGLEVLEKVDKRGGGNPPFFLMYTSSNDGEDKTTALSYSFVKGYFVKGKYDREELRETIFKEE